MINLNCNPVSSIDELLNINKDYQIRSKRENDYWIQYKEIIISFDIETSSFIYNGNKCAAMYCWQMGIEGNVYIGRSWEELEVLINKMIKVFKVNFYNRVVIWVHNLPYEFQWICKRFEFVEVFARSERKPMKALTSNGLEFRCSYALSGCSLAKVGENLTKYKIQKMVGDIDHDKIRGPKTLLSDKEIGYVVNDCLVLNAYIDEQLDLYGSITKIPMTNTGRVRRLMREKCFTNRHYKAFIHELNITNENELLALERAFQGGFTHANYSNVGIEENSEHFNVWSKDFTSSYPTVMLSEFYPMSEAELLSSPKIEDIEKMRSFYCFVFNVRIKGLKPKLAQDNPLSFSKCWNLKNPVKNNGRILQADELVTTVTDVDFFEILRKFYIMDSVEIGLCFKYKKGQLPKEIYETVISLYKDKTQYKDVDDKIIEYMLSKGMLNSTYGMMVMSLEDEEIKYDRKGWSTNKKRYENKNHGKTYTPNYAELIKKYNDDKNRFLFYPWGVFITAYARRNLFYAIEALGDDYLYADTDSVKYKNPEKYEKFFESYNDYIIKKLTYMVGKYGYTREDIEPETVQGKKKPLGVFDDDGKYTRFKTLGAKRYMCEYYDTEKKKYVTKFTVAGVSKKGIGDYLSEEAVKKNTDIFNLFIDDLCVPAEYSGRLCSFYIDDETHGYMTDYLGQKFEFHEKSSLHLGKSSFNMSIPDEYLKLIGQGVDYYL